MAQDFPILLRIWFVILGATLIAVQCLPGQWYYKNTHTPVPPIARWIFAILMGGGFILAGLFAHVSK